MYNYKESIKEDIREYLKEALDEFDCDSIDYLEKGAEWCDVIIRCYLLGECLREVLDELE